MVIPQLHNKLQASLGSMTICLKTEKQKQTNKETSTAKWFCCPVSQTCLTPRLYKAKQTLDNKKKKKGGGVWLHRQDT